MIVENTSKIISIAQYPVSNRTARLTDKIELKALLGLLYVSGVRKTNHLNASDLWEKNGMAIELFLLTMSLDRFRFRDIRFDDKLTGLQAEVNNLKENIKINGTTENVANMDPFESEEVIAELMERQQRASNIMIGNVKEPQSKSSQDAKKKT
ncbi:hypothetical protein NQ314_018434 [Rhamnusium bicolor]|uniref:PiggyBac transposable element-derived protein domain-containing protein n=1 Tax=Rhamnusium bicolor TaxID=1586634 RepID=A0AAV8WRR2_9CUCU|nr:hypothetical protein NQ314_018434 [Rhamnusium bicolor]